MNVHATNHPAFPGKNALILLYDVASENHNIGMIHNTPNPTNNPANTAFVVIRATPIPMNSPIGNANKIVANPLKR